MTIWVLFLLLSIISLVEVYSSIGLLAYSSNGGSSPTSLFLKHMFIVAATWVVVILLSRINYRYFSRFALLGFWLSVVLLAVMFVLRDRWLKIPLIGQFQPSEVAKVMLVIFLARMMALKKGDRSDIGTFFTLLGYIALISFLVFPGNFSTAALIFVSCYLMIYLGGVNRRWWWRLLLAATAVGLIGLTVTYYKYENSLKNNAVPQTQEQLIERASTWGHRVHSWVNPDTLLSQENMARMAIARGGILGEGAGSTIHARLMTQAHNDFIYAIIIEEFGMVGALVVFVLYGIFYFRCVRIAWRCKGRFGALTVAGIGTMIYIQALVNMCVAVGALPVTGQTLPFISYGGTAYLFLGLGLGVIQSVAADVQREEKKELEGNETETTETDETPVKELRVKS